LQVYGQRITTAEFKGRLGTAKLKCTFQVANKALNFEIRNWNIILSLEKKAKSIQARSYTILSWKKRIYSKKYWILPCHERSGNSSQKGKCKWRVSFQYFAQVRRMFRRWPWRLSRFWRHMSHFILRNKAWWRPQLTFSRLQFRWYFSKPANWVPPWLQDASSKFYIKGRAAVTLTLVSHKAPNKQHEVHNSCKYLLISFLVFHSICNAFKFKNFYICF
jgi:hypothetical protein